MSHHAAAAAASVSAHELISIPPPPPLISLGHLEKVERGRQRKSEVSDGCGARYIEFVRLCCFGMLIKLRGGTEMATAAPRGALKSKQLYPGFLRGVREKCACLSSSLQTRVHPLPLLSAGSPAVRKRTEAFSPSLLFDYLCPLLCRGCCFMASIKVGQAPLPSVLMLSFKSLKVAVLLLRQRPLPVRSELGVMGKRKEPHSDQDERDGERERASSQQPEFSPRLPPFPLSPPPAVSLFIIIVIRGGGGGRKGTLLELGLRVELPVVW